nr:unnamed protein product [Digitaria exilis]
MVSSFSSIPKQDATATSHAASPPRRGDGCRTGCDLALGSYDIERNQNLTYIASLFRIDDYLKLQPYNNLTIINLDYIQVGTRVTVYFPCRCLTLPTAPFSTYLAASFPYKVSRGDNYSSIAANFQNLTTAAWLQATNGYPSNKILDRGTVNSGVPGGATGIQAVPNLSA